MFVCVFFVSNKFFKFLLREKGKKDLRKMMAKQKSKIKGSVVLQYSKKWSQWIFFKAWEYKEQQEIGKISVILIKKLIVF